MTMPEQPNGRAQEPVSTPGQTIDLQGVSAFVNLMELLAQELGSTAGKMLGNLPSGPNSFNELIGEIDLNSQGFFRKVTLFARPGSPLTMRFHVGWNDGRGNETKSTIGGVTADYYLGITVAQVLPQARALARYTEDIFAVLDRMVTLGQSNKLAAMSVPVSELQAFEQREGDSVIKQHTERSLLRPH